MFKKALLSQKSLYKIHKILKWHVNTLRAILSCRYIQTRAQLSMVTSLRALFCFFVDAKYSGYFTILTGQNKVLITDYMII